MSKGMRLAIFLLVAMLCAGGSAMAACGTGAVLYQDDFAKLDPAWNLAGTGRHVTQGKNAVVISSNAGGSDTVLYQAGSYTDYEVCVQVQMNFGTGDASGQIGGLVFWALDYSNYYVLEYAQNGTYSVSRLHRKRWLRPVSWRKSDAIKTGPNQVNELRAVVKGNQGTVYVNGTKLIDFTGQPPGSSQVGLHSESPAKGSAVFQFATFRVLKPS